LKTYFENKIFENTILACIYEILFGAILLHYFKIQILPKYNFGSILSCVFKILFQSILPITDYITTT